MLNLNKIINGNQRAHFDLQIGAFEPSKSHHNMLIFNHAKIEYNINLSGLIRYKGLPNNSLWSHLGIGDVLHGTGLLIHDNFGRLWIKNLSLDKVALTKPLINNKLTINKRMQLYITRHQSKALKSYLDYGNKG